jgi:hypothetical protein
MSDVVVRLGGQSRGVERNFRDDSVSEDFNVREFIELRRVSPATDAPGGGDAAGDLLEVIKPGMFVYGLIEELQGVPYTGCRLQLDRLPVFYVLEFVEKASVRRKIDADPRAASVSENAEALVLRCKPLSELRGGTLKLKTREQAYWTDLVIGDQPFYLPIDSIVTKMPAVIGLGPATPRFDTPRRVALHATLVDEELQFETGGEIRRLTLTHSVLRPPFDDAALEFFPGVDAVAEELSTEADPTKNAGITVKVERKDDLDGDDDDDADDAAAAAAAASGEPLAVRRRRRRNASLLFTHRKRRTSSSLSPNGAAATGTGDADDAAAKRPRRRLSASATGVPSYKTSGYVPTGNPRGRPWWKERGEKPPPAWRGSRRELGMADDDDAAVARGLALLGDAVLSTATSSAASVSAAAAATTARRAAPAVTDAPGGGDAAGDLLEVIKPGMFVYGLIEELQGVPYTGCRLQLDRLPVFYVLEFVEKASVRRKIDADPRAASVSENAEALVLRCKPLSELRGGTLKLKTREQAYWTDLVIGDQPFYLPIDSIVTKMPAVIGLGPATPRFDTPRRVALHATLVDEELQFETGGEIRRLTLTHSVLRPPFDDAALEFFPGVDAVAEELSTEADPTKNAGITVKVERKDDLDGDDDDDADDAAAAAAAASGEPLAVRRRRRRNASLLFTHRKRRTSSSLSPNGAAATGTGDADDAAAKRPRRRLSASATGVPSYKTSGYVPTGNPRGRPWWKERGEKPPPAWRGSRRELGMADDDDAAVARGLALLGDAVLSTATSSAASVSAAAAATAALAPPPRSAPSPPPPPRATPQPVATASAPRPLLSAPPPPPLVPHAAPSSPPPSPTFAALYAQQRAATTTQTQRPPMPLAAPPTRQPEPSNADVDEACALPVDQVDLSLNPWQKFKPQLVRYIVGVLETPGRDEALYRASARVRQVFSDLTRTRLGGEFGAFVDATLHAHPELTARFLSRFSEPYIRVAHSFVVRPIVYRELCFIAMADGVEPIGNDILSLALSMRKAVQ